MDHAALILAAGRGARIQDLTADKILAPLAGHPAITYSVAAFVQSGCVKTVAIVYRDEDQRRALESALADSSILSGRATDLLWVAGGDERQDSVLNGLRSLPAETGLVFIHDAARPLITAETIRRLAAVAGKSGAACLARPVTDTIKQIDPVPGLDVEAFTLKTIDRSRLRAMETPQVFDRRLIQAAYEKAGAAGRRFTDDAAALEEAGAPVALVESLVPNPKLTTAPDVAFIEYLLLKERRG